jgi:hypothetical protein
VSEVTPCAAGKSYATTAECRDTLATTALRILNGTNAAGDKIVKGNVVNRTDPTDPTAILRPTTSADPTFDGKFCTKAVVRETTSTELPAKNDPMVDAMSSYAATMQRWWGDLLQASLPA